MNLKNSQFLVIQVISVGIYYNSVGICECVWLKQLHNKCLLN